jgi:hypothetical protein
VRNPVGIHTTDGFRTGDIATGRDGECRVGTTGMGDAILARL